MTHATQAALSAFDDLMEWELAEYLHKMVLLHPDTFLELVQADHRRIMDELREERHNGYSMYPELDL